MIVVREISKSYGRVRAVRSVSFEVGAGCIAGLLGPNGAGKTTTIRMITGTLTPDAGSISVAGYDVARAPTRARGQIGYLPESAPLYPELTPAGYLDHRGRLFGMPRAERRKAAQRVIDRCALGPMKSRRIGALSKGYRQRVGLAAALLHDPPVLVLDEPTNGLDPSQIRETRSLIRELAEDRTMLLCTHILPEVERTCDRVIVIGSGRVLADGTPAELTERSPGEQRYLIEARTNPSAGVAPLLATFRPIAGVRSAEPDEAQPDDAASGWSRVVITADPDAPDLREPIAGAAADAGLFVRELTRERQTLESLFVRLVDRARERTDAEGGS
ncbi:MAG: ABC transporter ATP-binding protein [Phycisphaerales bacterium]